MSCHVVKLKPRCRMSSFSCHEEMSVAKISVVKRSVTKMSVTKILEAKTLASFFGVKSFLRLSI